jgi:hypothetical protein
LGNAIESRKNAWRQDAKRQERNLIFHVFLRRFAAKKFGSVNPRIDGHCGGGGAKKQFHRCPGTASRGGGAIHAQSVLAIGERLKHLLNRVSTQDDVPSVARRRRKQARARRGCTRR